MILKSKLFNFLPIGYVFQSRIITKAERISWFLIFPSFLSIFVVLNDYDYFLFTLNFLVVISSYEIGYLYNDIITTKKEKEPTLRHADFHEENFIYCVIIRVVFSIFISTIIWFVYDFVTFLWAFSSAVILNLFFYLHNTIRSRFNVITYFLLVCGRYVFPIFIFSTNYQILSIILIFPLCRTLEHACKKKYGFSRLQSLIGNPDFFRVWYLSIVSITIYSLFDDINCFYISMYFLCLRLLALFVSETKFFKRNKHGSY